MATASAFTASSVAGSFTVNASVQGHSLTNAVFQLTNVGPVTIPANTLLASTLGAVDQVLESGLTLDASDSDTFPRMSVKISGQSHISSKIVRVN